MNNNKIKGLAEPSEDSHAANMKYVNNQIQTQVNSLFSKNSHSYDLQPNFTFVSLYPGSVFNTGRGGTLLHNHGIWYRVTPVVISGQYFVLNFSAQHNNLKPGNYTALFELYSLYNGSKINDVSTMTFDNTAANSNYKFIQLKSRRVDNNYKKIIMQFEVIRNPGVLNGKLKWRRILIHLINSARFIFFHRIIEGLYDLDFDHGVFDADPQQLFFIDSLSLNNKRLTDVADPTDPKDSVNKYYVDDEIAKLPHSDTGTLKLDGSRAMTGTLNLGGQRVVNIKGFVEDDSSQSASDAQKYDVVNWGKIHEIRGDLKREINAVEYEALNRINPNPMEDDIDMGNNFITNIKDPQPLNSQYAATVNFVNKTVSDNNSTIVTNYQKYVDDRLKYSVQSADKSNAFQYVMDNPAGQFYHEDDIKGIKKTVKDFHKINKETYEMQLLLDSRGYYSSRLGVNMYILPNGEYSLVYEL